MTNFVNIISAAGESDISIVPKISKISGKFSSENFSSVLKNQNKSTKFSDNSNFDKSNQPDTKNEYDKFNYKDNSIQKEKTKTPEEKLGEFKDDIIDVQNKIVEIISEEFDISEDEIINTLENLGLSLIQLLDPQNLASAVIDIKNADSSAELLVDSGFQNLINNINLLSNELFESMGSGNQPEALEQLVSMMNMTEEPIEFDAIENINNLNEVIDDNSEKILVKTNDISADNVETSNAVNENQMIDKTIVKSDAGDNLLNSNNQDLSQNDKNTYQNEMDSEIKTDEQSVFARKNLTSDEADSFQEITFNNKTNTIQFVSENNPANQTQSYVSINTKEIIAQIADNVRINQSIDTANIQMQLNPENLGRIYLNISSKEGAVSATITATNEAVKEALEAQIINLKENLSQNGIKVDAVEVTVASHEFERNLEQNSSKDEQNAMYHENNNKRRKNIDISSLDDLSGIMSEEENLLAQIMKENGNSVDYMA